MAPPGVGGPFKKVAVNGVHMNAPEPTKLGLTTNTYIAPFMHGNQVSSRPPKGIKKADDVVGANITAIKTNERNSRAAGLILRSILYKQ